MKQKKMQVADMSAAANCPTTYHTCKLPVKNGGKTENNFKNNFIEKVSK
jgi:hypothetical protein